MTHGAPNSNRSFCAITECHHCSWWWAAYVFPFQDWWPNGVYACRLLQKKKQKTLRCVGLEETAPDQPVHLLFFPLNFNFKAKLKVQLFPLAFKCTLDFYQSTGNVSVWLFWYVCVCFFFYCETLCSANVF